MDGEDEFAPPEVEYVHPAAAFLAGAAAAGPATYDDDEESDVDLDEFRSRLPGLDDDTTTLRGAEPPAYVGEPPNYEQEVYGDEAADVGSSVLDALYGLTISRIDDNSAGAQEGTRLRRGRTVPGLALEAVQPLESWWDRELYSGIQDICIGDAPLHAGVPYGKHVRGGNWSDTHLKLRDMTELNKYYRALQVGPRAEGECQIHQLDGTDVSCRWFGVWRYGAPTTEFLFEYGRSSCSVYIQWEDEGYRDVADVYISCDLLTLRKCCNALADRVSMVLSAYSVGVLEEELNPRSVLQLNDSSLKEMKSLVSRTQHGAQLRAFGATVAHGLSTIEEDLAGEPNDQHVDFSQWQRDRGVYYGRLRASDVPPSQLVLLGANGGLSVSGSMMVVRALGTHNISLVCTSATANYSFRNAVFSKKHAPCVRDGLMSPIACAALHGDASGLLTVTVGTETQTTETILTDAIRSAADATVRTLDINGTRAALADLGALCGYKTTEWLGSRNYWVRFTGHEREFKVGLQYGAGTITRWEGLLSAYVRSDIGEKLVLQTDSEIGIDWGASGLGRYLLVPYTRFGLLNTKKRIMVAKRGPFSALTYDDNGKRRIIAPSAEVVNYVIDTEYVNVKRDGALMTYVYAMGIAKFSQGAYMGSWSAVDLAENTDTLLGTLSEQEARGHASAIQALRDDGVQGTDMVEVLTAVRRRLLTNPHVRIYAKGRDAEQRLMSSSLVGGTRMFRAQAAAAGDIIRELGPLLPKYDDAVAAVGWPKIHNPAREAVLFGYLAGLCVQLPAPHLAGLDGLNAIMPASGGVQI